MKRGTFVSFLPCYMHESQTPEMLFPGEFPGCDHVCAGDSWLECVGIPLTWKSGIPIRKAQWTHCYSTKRSCMRVVAKPNTSLSSPRGLVIKEYLHCLQRHCYVSVLYGSRERKRASILNLLTFNAMLFNDNLMTCNCYDCFVFVTMNLKSPLVFFVYLCLFICCFLIEVKHFVLLNSAW